MVSKKVTIGLEDDARVNTEIKSEVEFSAYLNVSASPFSISVESSSALLTSSSGLLLIRLIKNSRLPEEGRPLLWVRVLQGYLGGLDSASGAFLGHSLGCGGFGHGPLLKKGRGLGFLKIIKIESSSFAVLGVRVNGIRNRKGFNQKGSLYGK